MNKIDKMKIEMPYRILSGNSDGSIKKGDIVWLSENGDLNNATCKGWLSKEDCNDDGVADFIATPDDRYVVIKTYNTETLQRRDE